MNKFFNPRFAMIIAVCLIISGLCILNLPLDGHTAISSQDISIENISSYSDLVIYKGNESSNRPRSSSILNLQLLLFVFISFYLAFTKSNCEKKYADIKPFWKKLYALLSPKQNTGRFKNKSLSIIYN